MAKRWLIALVKSFLIALALLYFVAYFDLTFVREAGGRPVQQDGPDIAMPTTRGPSPS